MKVAVVLGILSLCMGWRGDSAPSPLPSLPPGATGFAVVELYTSEGCSSCPPADQVLAAMADTYKGFVFALGFHVDYWDKLGWKDKYSNAAYSQRQKDYQHILGLPNYYTPQVVINGTQEMVGSNGIRLDSAIRAALTTEFPATLSARDSVLGPGKYRVFYTTNVPSKYVVHLALYQKHAVDTVNAGENQGATLEHINVVRDFITTAISKTGTGQIDVSLPSDLDPKDAGLVLFAQDQRHGKVFKALQLAL